MMRVTRVVVAMSTSSSGVRPARLNIAYDSGDGYSVVISTVRQPACLRVSTAE